MRKRIAILLVLVLCCGLCACGGGERVVLPTTPEQMAKPSLPAREPQSDADAAVESTEAAQPTGETYPWEAEFREEDYFVYVHTEPKVGKFTNYLEVSILGTCVRTVSEYTNGEISDTYFYPNGVDSHSYTWYPDGSYVEYHHLNDGRIDLTERKTYLGTVIYQKNVAPDGSWREYHSDENGTLTFATGMEADGTCWETYCYENGNPQIDISDNPSTGEHGETEFYENGTTKKYVISNSLTGMYFEQEYFENGNMKYLKDESPEHTIEERYDEEGFRTYFYSKDANYEIELTADETGKLVKVVENGTVIEDTATLAQYEQNYNFRQ